MAMWFPVQDDRYGEVWKRYMSSVCLSLTRCNGGRYSCRWLRGVRQVVLPTEGLQGALQHWAEVRTAIPSSMSRNSRVKTSDFAHFSL